MFMIRIDQFYISYEVKSKAILVVWIRPLSCMIIN